MTDGASPRVLVVLASNDRRGAEIEGERLAQELAGHGFLTEVVALSAGHGRSALPVPALGEQALAAGTVRALRRRARDADVVVAYGSTTLPACALALTGTRIPFVYRSIGDPSRWVRGFTHRLRTGALMHRAASVVALWDRAAADLRSLYRLRSDRVQVIANGRDPREFRPVDAATRSAARDRLGIRDRRVVAIVGALAEEKRIGLAIAAVEQLPDTHLLIAGDGPLRSTLEAQAAQTLGERCTFTGALDDVREVLHAADVLLLTSRTEGMPGAVIEAALGGIAVVATDVGAMAWLAHEGVRARLVPVESDPTVFAAALREAPAPESTPPSLPAIDLTTTTRLWADVLRDLTRHR